MMMDVGIIAMHYVGTYAMQIQLAIQYNLFLLLISFAISIFISLAVIIIIYKIGLYKNQETAKQIRFQKNLFLQARDGLGGDQLVALVIPGALLILLTALHTAIFDARLAEQNAVMVMKLKQLNHSLIGHY